MKLSKNFTAFSVALAAFVAAGCATHKTVVPLGGGFEAVAHAQRTLIDEPPPPRIALQQRAKDGTITRIWPAMFCTDTVINGPLIIFVAEKAYVEPDHVTHPRLFAAEPPGLPLDLTDEVLWRWCKANNRDFGMALPKLASVTPAKDANGLVVQLGFWAAPAYGEARSDWPDSSSLNLTWQQVNEIIHAVNTKGVTEKDLRWHSEYIGEKF